MNQGWCHNCGRQYMWADSDSSNCPDCSVKLSELQTIVQAVATQSPRKIEETFQGDVYQCRFCDHWAYRPSDIEHDDACLWLRARKVIELP